ncbi:MAG TPA: PIN domain-containing protein [Actinomycetota bacterium]|nr:PIN domain-containing protein [Actinomycetota bacterium]
MRALVDTSALYALLDEDDANHAPARDWFTSEASVPSTILATHSYVIVESCALVQRRLGPEAVSVLLDTFIPSFSVLYVDEDLHQRAAAAYMASFSKRGVSFVDRVSFEMIRKLALDVAFAFDVDFEAEGFQMVPAGGTTKTAQP